MRVPLMALCLALAASVVPAAASAQTASDPVEAKVTAIRDRMVAAVRACGVQPGFVPAVLIATNGSVISYSHKTLTIGRWEELPPPLQGLFDGWAAQETPGETGKALFDDLFNGFLVAHELGHWVGDWSGRWATLDRWDSEMEANRFAIAFARLDPAITPTQLEKTVSEFAFIRQGPGPVPTGQDERHYFDANYDALSRHDPVAYGWFQGRLMQLAWEQRDAGDFCDLVKLPPDLVSGHNPNWVPPGNL